MPSLGSHAWTAAAFLAAALFFGVPGKARAHDPGLSSLDVRLEPDRIVATLSLAASDARIAAAERNGEIDVFALDSIELRIDGVRMAGAVEKGATRSEAGIRVLAFSRVAGSRLTVRSIVPERLAPGHRELLTIRKAGGGVLAERLLDARDNELSLDLGPAPRSVDVAGQFLGLGVRHILGGYDHLLFLAALLMGVRRLRSVVSTVTAFTVAHSITLALAVLGLARMPAALVEPAIAASVVFVGLENLLREEIHSRWKLTFAFGLVHGFGFAGALQELGIGAPGVDVVAPLGWFNAGVEAGQIGVAILVWPLIRAVNARPVLRTRLAPGCSLLVVGAGTYWLVERTLL